MQFNITCTLLWLQSIELLHCFSEKTIAQSHGHIQILSSQDASPCFKYRKSKAQSTQVSVYQLLLKSWVGIIQSSFCYTTVCLYLALDSVSSLICITYTGFPGAVLRNIFQTYFFYQRLRLSSDSCFCVCFVFCLKRLLTAKWPRSI